MRTASKLLLLAVGVVLMVTAFVNTSSANEPVEAHDELGNHCDPCVVNFTGESQIIAAGPTVVSSCEDAFSAEVYEDGAGHITGLTTQDHGSPPCITQACTGTPESAAEAEWPLQIEENGGAELMEVRFCLENKNSPNSSGEHCDATATLQNHGSHEYELTMNELCPNGLTVAGVWEIEGSPIEIEHPADPASPVEVHDETGTHCNPCNIEMHGESQILARISTCEDDFTAEVYEDGSGHVTDLTNENYEGLPCAVEKCNGTGEPAAETEWPIQVGESGPGQEVVAIRFCLDSAIDPNGSGEHCDANADIVNDGDHRYELSMNKLCPNGLTVIGDWEVEGSPIELEHPLD